jgi:DNA (cytosine-5)-methyltransferase 1
MKYVEVVDAIRPAALLVENVPGMRVAHGSKGAGRRPGRPRKAFSERLLESLDELGYSADGMVLDASRFGVPQRRPRFVVIGFRKDLVGPRSEIFPRLHELIENTRLVQLAELGLKLPVSSRDAISDLQTKGVPLQPCTDPESPPGFLEIVYSGPRSSYQRFLNKGVHASKVNSLRLTRHSERIRDRYKRILRECDQGIQRAGFRMDDAARARFGLLKQRIHPMAANRPAPTVTTLPDDLLHYSEPRILSARECARLQSFPDWFRFLGKYTTGGAQRARECPRFTQIGNAVPPLLGRALGAAIAASLDELTSEKEVHIRRRAG